jgi:hypothetical protein
MFRIRLSRVLALLLLPAALPSMASANSLEAVPTGWRLENYISNHTVKLWFTPATECTSGGIEVGSMSQDDHNRLWSLILTSKIANRPVGIYYNASAGNCTMISFYAP